MEELDPIEEDIASQEIVSEDDLEVGPGPLTEVYEPRSEFSPVSVPNLESLRQQYEGWQELPNPQAMNEDRLIEGEWWIGEERNLTQEIRERGDGERLEQHNQILEELRENGVSEQLEEVEGKLLATIFYLEGDYIRHLVFAKEAEAQEKEPARFEEEDGWEIEASPEVSPWIDQTENVGNPETREFTLLDLFKEQVAEEGEQTFDDLESPEENFPEALDLAVKPPALSQDTETIPGLSRESLQEVGPQDLEGKLEAVPPGLMEQQEPQAREAQVVELKLHYLASQEEAEAEPEPEEELIPAQVVESGGLVHHTAQDFREVTETQRREEQLEIEDEIHQAPQPIMETSNEFEPSFTQPEAGVLGQESVEPVESIEHEEILAQDTSSVVPEARDRADYKIPAEVIATISTPLKVASSGIEMARTPLEEPVAEAFRLPGADKSADYKTDNVARPPARRSPPQADEGGFMGTPQDFELIHLDEKAFQDLEPPQEIQEISEELSRVGEVILEEEPPGPIEETEELKAIELTGAEAEKPESEDKELELDIELAEQIMEYAGLVQHTAEEQLEIGDEIHQVDQLEAEAVRDQEARPILIYPAPTVNHEHEPSEEAVLNSYNLKAPAPESWSGVYLDEKAFQAIETPDQPDQEQFGETTLIAPPPEIVNVAEGFSARGGSPPEARLAKGGASGGRLPGADKPARRQGGSADYKTENVARPFMGPESAAQVQERAHLPKEQVVVKQVQEVIAAPLETQSNKEPRLVREIGFSELSFAQKSVPPQVLDSSLEEEGEELILPSQTLELAA